MLIIAGLRQRRLFLSIAPLLIPETTLRVPLLQRWTTHASTISKPESAIRTTDRRSRHIWTPEGDEKLVSLATKHGLKWTTISKEMNLGLSVMSYRRRWEVLHASNQGAWTLAEDRKLERSVEMLAQSKSIGRYGLWVQVAKLMNTKRTPRDCYWRWNSTVRRLPGDSNLPLRTKGVNIKTWSEVELRRFSDALSALTDSGDSTAAVDRAREKEPWLVPMVEPQFTQPAGFWTLVAENVGTRTAQQCRSHWQVVKTTSQFGNRPSDMIISVSETKRLARIVEQHGKRWTYIHEHHFPRIPYHYLCSVYNQWRRTADKYQVDLHTVDPEKMLIDYEPGSCTALRRTGTNGLYDPNGTLRIVKVFHSRSPLVPFRLALMPSLDHCRYLEGSKSGATTFKPRSFIMKGNEASHDADLLHCGTDTLNRLIKSLAAYGEDWVAIGKDMGLRASQCQRLYNDVVKILPSMKAAALAGEIHVKNESQVLMP
ncbi:hypothetical protein GGH94_005996 [Coemansia aciculifera]|uniref:Myb-like domain-containing protein n=1 Tax=Coemansia aciculifera TaxID=417176 RepID=A0A9W8ICK0_9FUNG|nr:hypothetical protein GGH94_006004 [Coemansia aciculifera]KAJ2859639.1 hypothetical protein GGH94_005996 [Coemansia aciculifera]